MVTAQKLLDSPDKPAKTEALKTCKLARYWGAKLHLSVDGLKTLCGRPNAKLLNKTKPNLSKNCCKFCRTHAARLKLEEIRVSGHGAIVGNCKPMFSSWLKPTSVNQS